LLSAAAKQKELANRAAGEHCNKKPEEWARWIKAGLLLFHLNETLLLPILQRLGEEPVEQAFLAPG